MTTSETGDNINKMTIRCTWRIVGWGQMLCTVMPSRLAVQLPLDMNSIEEFTSGGTATARREQY